MCVASFTMVWMKVDVAYTILGCVFFHSWDKEHPEGLVGWQGRRPLGPWPHGDTIWTIFFGFVILSFGWIS